MRHVIVGAGAIGVTLGHHLAKARHEVVVDAEHADRLRREEIAVRCGEERPAVPVAGAPTDEQRIAELAGVPR
ncbi:2-dehydropantoate 2-reductase N-terminal domain-containing protein [Pseudonocardia acidicola]|uniref:Ketopantoate reductase N-terminal domain-containing protein n=1 Tax=Pseudonocardia acidicola TaxID=2724939 RepID=A0ABX1S5J3_9PSEU|nr:2-dehydropantoate 2-reductase N-terminal domain-containing protein [Pseudonocardia acidicola]NMH96850.1 hypothetical protein [Pseudonocardia acidicola]